MSEMLNITEDEVSKFKNFMNEYSKEIGATTALVGELITDKFVTDLLKTAKQAGYDQLKYASSLSGLNVQTSLMELNSATSSLAKMLKAGGPTASVLASIYNGWKEDNIPNELTKTVTSLAVGAWIGSIAALTTLPASVPIAVAALAGYFIDKYWDDSIDQLSDGIAYLLEKMFIADFKNNMSSIKILFSTAEVTPSPLIIDLDGDGVETSKVENGVYFDHDGNGFAEKTAWAGKDDGILVRDINNNGQIDNGTELFGNNSVLSSGAKAANGFEALKDLDSNGDGVFNSQDTTWNEVKVWKDGNSNGVVDAGELLTLAEANINGINLNYTEIDSTDDNGNAHSQTGTVVKSDGTETTVTDVWFQADLTNSVDKSDIEIPEAIAALPEVEGFGNVHSLRRAMALDATGALKTLVEQYMAETDRAARDSLLTEIIYHWSGVQDMNPNGRNPTKIYGNVLGDSRKLEALEEFMGKEYLGTWCWGERDPNPHGAAAPHILKAFDDLKDYLNQQLLSQTHYKNIIDNISFTYNEQTSKWEADASAALPFIENIYNSSAEPILFLRDLADVLLSFGDIGQNAVLAIQSCSDINGTAFEVDLMNFSELANSATAGNDTIDGNDNNDYLFGGAGNDRLYGHGGNDVLEGGSGNDFLVGGNGADIYRFNAGFGNDSIDNTDDDASSENPDIIQFGNGILPENTVLERLGYDLIIKVSYADETVPTDSITVLSYFNELGQDSKTVNFINFADGTSWDYEYVATHWNRIPAADGGGIYEGTANNDNIYGSAGSDILLGNGGNDYILAGNGNDLLIGGAGNDILCGEGGVDTYIYNLGDGLDTLEDAASPEGSDIIRLGKGISVEDLSFRAENKDLRIIVKGDETQGLILTSYFHDWVDDYRNKLLEFTDGRCIDLNQVALTLHQTGKTNISATAFNDVIYMADVSGNMAFGRDGDDAIYGSSYADSIYGDAGNDTLIGNGGNDVIIGGSGDDAITGGTGNDILRGEGGVDTYIYNLGDGLDTLEDAANLESCDIIRLGSGISVEDLSFRAENKDLRIIIKGDETQGLILTSYFHDWVDDYRNKLLEFADGSTLNLNQIALTLHQTGKINLLSLTIHDDVVHLADVSGNNVTDNKGGNDTFYGGSFADTINGANGNDVIYGNGGNDTLVGEVGDDVLYGGDGNDTVFGDDYNSTWNIVGNDTITGGAGNDILYGGFGNDTYVWNLGDDLDTIRDVYGNDIIQLGENITRDNLSFSQSGNNLQINVNNDETQGLILEDYFVSAGHKNKTIVFDDDTTLDLRNSDALIQAMNSFCASNASAMDINTSPLQDVSAMCDLSCTGDLSKKAA